MSASIPEIRATQCLRYRYRYSECARCAAACPHDAITLSDEGVALDPVRCQNCALCTSACRTGALVAGNLKRVELLKRAIKETRFSFACAPSQQAADAVVPCLGAIEGGMLAYLGKRRIAVELRGSRHCPDCAHGGRGAAQLALNLDAARALQGIAADEQWTMPELPSPEPAADQPAPVSAARRQLFRRFIGRGVDALAEPAEPSEAVPVPEKAIRAGPLLLNEQRELLEIVCKRADGKPFPVARHDGLPLMEVRLATGCTHCEACFRVCPTGAMLVEETPTAWALTFDPQRCVACEACLEVCQPGVLGAAEVCDGSPQAGRRALHRMGKQRCTRCDRFFVSAQPRDACPVCTDDEAAFAEIFG